MVNESNKPIVKTLRILYPIWMIVGIFSLLYVPSQIQVSGEPIETAANIQSKALLYRLGILGRIITHLFTIVIPVLLYFLFESTNRILAFFMMILCAISAPIAMFSEAHSLHALTFLDQPQFMDEQLSLHWIGNTIASIF